MDEEREVSGGTSLRARPLVLRQESQYLVKLRCFSYARSKWLDAKEIEADGKLSKNALQRFLRRLADGEPVDPSYKDMMQLQRVISHRQAKDSTDVE